MTFGKDITEKIGDIELEDAKTGCLVSLDFFGAFNKIVNDCTSVNLNPFVILFPKFVELKLGKTNKANVRNVERFFLALDRFILESQDEHSLYTVLIKSGVTDHEGAI